MEKKYYEMCRAAEQGITFQGLSFKQGMQFHSIYRQEQGIFLHRKPLKES